MTAKEFNDFVMSLESLEQQAHRAGLHDTAHALNAAKNRAGWERADTLEKTVRAADNGSETCPR